MPSGTGSPLPATKGPSLSPSRAADFKTCPLLFRFRTIDRLPEQPTRDQVRGTLVHAVLERLFDLPAGARTPEAAAALVRPEWERLLGSEPELSALFDDPAEAPVPLVDGPLAAPPAPATALSTEPSTPSPGPSASPAGPSASSTGPSTPPPGPTASPAGPSASSTGPSTPPPGPTASPAGPSASSTGPSASAPSTEAGATTTEAGATTTATAPASSATPASGAAASGAAGPTVRGDGVLPGMPEVPAEDEAARLERFLRDAGDLLAGYFAVEDPNRLEPAERESLISTLVDDELLIRGYIDRLDISPAGDLRVVDYKTGGAPREAFEGRALFQLKFYALVLWRTRGVVPRVLRLLYLKDAEACDYSPDAEELERFERTLLALSRAIEQAKEQRDFRPKPSRLCGWCSHQQFCPEFGGTPPPYPEPTAATAPLALVPAAATATPGLADATSATAAPDLAQAAHTPAAPDLAPTAPATAATAALHLIPGAAAHDHAQAAPATTALDHVQAAVTPAAGSPRPGAALPVARPPHEDDLPPSRRVTDL